LAKAVEFFLKGGHKLAQVHTVDCSMIATHCQVDGVVDKEAIINDDRPSFDCANGQYRNLGRIDNGREPVDLLDNT
jgi:hypothetical protein